MSIRILPKSLFGRCAATLSAIFIIAMALKISQLVRLPIPSYAIAAVGLAGLAAAIAALVKKDRSLLVFLSLLVGLVILIWIAAEFIFPH